MSWREEVICGRYMTIIVPIVRLKIFLPWGLHGQWEASYLEVYMGNLDFFKTKMFCTNSSNNDVTITLMLLSQRKDYIPLHVLQKWSLLVEGTAQPCCGSARQKLFYMIHLHLFISLLFSWVVFSSTYCSHYHYAFLNFKVYSALPPATR